MDETNQDQTPEQSPGRNRPRKPMPPELREFNTAAFFLSYYWAFKNGFKALGCLLAIPVALFFLNLGAFDISAVPTATALLAFIVMFSLFMGVTGNCLVWRAYDFKDAQDFLESQQELSNPGSMVWFGIIHLGLFVFLLLTVGHVPYNRDRSRFSACHSQLTNLQTAAQDYVAAGGQLRDLDGKIENLCVHMYAGVEKPSDCSTQLMTRIDKVCEEKSFRAKIIGDNRYEFKAVARDKYHTKICVTENAIHPDDYSYSSGQHQFHCDHSGAPLDVSPSAPDKAAPASGTVPLPDAGGPVAPAP